MDLSHPHAPRADADDDAVSTKAGEVVDLTEEAAPEVPEDDVPLSQRLFSRKLSKRSRSRLQSVAPAPARPHAQSQLSDPRLQAFPEPATMAAAQGNFVKV